MIGFNKQELAAIYETANAAANDPTTRPSQAAALSEICEKIKPQAEIEKERLTRMSSLLVKARNAVNAVYDDVIDAFDSQGGACADINQAYLDEALVALQQVKRLLNEEPT